MLIIRRSPGFDKRALPPQHPIHQPRPHRLVFRRQRLAQLAPDRDAPGRRSLRRDKGLAVQGPGQDAAPQVIGLQAALAEGLCIGSALAAGGAVDQDLLLVVNLFFRLKLLDADRFGDQRDLWSVPLDNCPCYRYTDIEPSAEETLAPLHCRPRSDASLR